MLTHLSIKNYALISALEVDFGKGFSVVTGETGAGKSIILGALSLILGQRADTGSFRDKEKKCVVEGTFRISHLGLNDFFQIHELDYEPVTILRREILNSGKSRAFINDTPVKLNVLKELSEKLVDIHSQNNTTTLRDEDFQLEVLDGFAGLEEELKVYKQEYEHLTMLKQQLHQREEAEKTARSEQDFYQFQYDELADAALLEGEEKTIEEELEVLNHAGEIKSRLQNAAQLLSSEEGILEKLSELLRQMNGIKTYKTDFAGFYQRFESNFLDLQDISRDIERIDESIDTDERKSETLTERLNLIYHLQQKHHCNSVEELIEVKNQYQRKLSEFSSLEEKIEKLKSDISRAEQTLRKRAHSISLKRHRAKPKLEKEVYEVIKELGLDKAQFVVELQTSETLTESGYDRAMLLFNANPGGEPAELSRIASGGELSRLMLAVKSVVAGKKFLSTIIFDEIDSGVSGEIAGKMGAIMQKMSSERQIIAITHLPQIAARGNRHYLVYKEHENDTTSTHLKLLNDNDRIIEIAKMLSDTKVSLSAVETARELLQN